MIGTIRNQVKLAVLDGQWQQKKQNMAKKSPRELTAEERKLQALWEQAEKIREGNKSASLDAKLKSGAKLTPEEIEYLRRNSPETLKEYEEAQRERENYKRQLRNCDSKEETQQLKLSKMGQFLSRCKEISTNPNIPKSKKLELLQKLSNRVAGIEAEHLEFTASLQYANLPKDEEEEKKNRESRASDTGTDDTVSQELTPVEGKDPVEELKELLAEASPAGQSIDAMV
ncbi:MAG: hypothetical protein NC081_05920 [Roseburia sp.]|nr:hypothetical protein [Roseburia sp.]